MPAIITVFKCFCCSFRVLVIFGLITPNNFSAFINNYNINRILTMVWEYLTAVRDSRVDEREKLVKLQKMWALRKPILDAHILSLQKRIQQLEGEIDGIVMEKMTI